jgi:hypothetical protein
MENHGDGGGVRTGGKKELAELAAVVSVTVDGALDRAGSLSRP